LEAQLEESRVRDERQTQKKQNKKTKQKKQQQQKKKDTQRKKKRKEETLPNRKTATKNNIKMWRIRTKSKRRHKTSDQRHNGIVEQNAKQQNH